MRHLGICPTEIELREMITEIEEEAHRLHRFEKFERMMSRILLENQYPRDPEDKLLRAFRTLDPDNNLVHRGGEDPHAAHDARRALLAGGDGRHAVVRLHAESGHFHYEDYVMQVTVS